MTDSTMTKTFKDLKPTDKVKTCKWLEIGCCMQLAGVHCCCHGTKSSPTLVTAEEINSGKASYELIVQRKTELFEAINGMRDMDIFGCKNCTNIIEKDFQDVSLDSIGGYHLGASFNIQHYTMCNERCQYCYYTHNNLFVPPQYDILKVFDMFKEKGKLYGNNIIDFSGGEPALLKDLDRILAYFDENNMGNVIVYSNAAIFSQKIYDLLKENKIYLTTSLDTGLASTYKELRGLDAFPQVVNNLIRYRNSGTSNMTLKYIITDRNRTEDDLWSFLTTIMAIRPNMVAICPDFPYGDREIPVETSKFAAKLWYLIEKYLGQICVDYTSYMGDPKWLKYRSEMYAELEELKKAEPLCDCTLLKALNMNLVVECNNTLPPLKPLTTLQKIFSIRNEHSHKVIRCMGIKLEIKRGKNGK